MNPNISGIIAIILWSISPLLIVGTGNTPPAMAGSMALFIASLTLLGQNCLIHKQNVTALIKHPKKLFLITTYGIGGYILFWLLAFDNAPVFEANTLNYLWPIALVALAITFKEERFSLFKIAGLILGLIGVVLLFAQKNELTFQLSTTYTAGYIYAILGAFIWASYSLMSRKIRIPNSGMAVFFIPPAVLLLAFHLLFETSYVPTLKELLFITLLGLTRISFSFWNHAMSNGRISLISSLSYFIPVISTILLVIFGHTPRTDMILISSLLILAGCLITNFELLKGKK